jgi:hypothetical protein
MNVEEVETNERKLKTFEKMCTEMRDKTIIKIFEVD